MDETFDSPELDRKALLALVDASRAINSEVGLADVIRKCTEWAAQVMQAEGASVIMYNTDRHEMEFRTAVGPQADQLKGVKFDADLGIAGQVLKTGRAMRVDDVRKNRHFFSGIDNKTHQTTRSLMAAPLIDKDQVLGVLEVLNPKSHENFNNRDLELLKVFANLVAIAAANAKAYDQVARQNAAFRQALPDEQMLGQSPAIQRVLELCHKVALANATVLLEGETGTGKELAARTIHASSSRRDQPFIAINCAALPETLLESELFGHEKGAFTGASGRKLGRFELADGGTVFLDEIGEVSLATQVKLLRVIQERQFVRVGGTEAIACDVRIIAATNRNLRDEITAGRFRDDLYYRLNVFPISMPPLRQRVEDIPLLIDHFLHEIAPTLDLEPPAVIDAAMSLFISYHWPGNIRELRNIVERCILLSAGGQITPNDLPPEITHPASQTHQVEGESSGSRLAEHERVLILNALHETDWNQSAAARLLGITRDHLRYRMKKYGMRPPDKS